MEQVFILTLHVQLSRLVLSQSVESLINGTVKLHLPRPGVALLFGQRADSDFLLRYPEGREDFSSPGCLCQQQMSLSVTEHHPSVGLTDGSTDGTCLHLHGILGLGNLKIIEVRLTDDHQALLHREVCFRGSFHPDNLVANHLKPYLSGTFVLRGTDGHCHRVALFDIIVGTGHGTDSQE